MQSLFLNNDIKMLEYLQTLGYDIRKSFWKEKSFRVCYYKPNKDIGREKQALYIKFEMYKYLIDSFKK